MQRPPELGSLRAELRLAGLFEYRELRGWLKLLGFAVGIAACLFGIAKLGWIAAIPLIPICAVLSTAAAMQGHEGSHKSFSPSPTRNAFLVNLVFPVFSGLGALYWHNKHDRLHHGHPNVEGVDPDIKPFPFVSSVGDHEKSKPGERWFQRHCQRWAFWPMSTLMALGMRRSSILYVMRFPKDHGFTRAWFLEIGCLTAHYIGWIGLPLFIWGWKGFVVYSLIWALVGVCLALVFAPAHIGLPIVNEQHHDWLHQVETTRNLKLPKFISYFFIGLDYQVEHHLFPKIPHQHLPRAAEITAAWCAKHGINHQSTPYLEALVDSARFMADAWSREAMDPVEVRAGLVGRAA